MSAHPARPTAEEVLGHVARDNLRLRAEVEALRKLLQQADALYASYGLLAQRPECGPWINAVRAALGESS